jgi:hypothetical protein
MESPSKIIHPKFDKTPQKIAVWVGICLLGLLWNTWKSENELSLEAIWHTFKYLYQLYTFPPIIATIIGLYVDIIRIEIFSSSVEINTRVRTIKIEFDKDYIKPEPSKISDITEAKIASVYVNKKRKLFIYFEDFHENDQKIIKTVIPVKYGRNNF